MELLIGRDVSVGKQLGWAEFCCHICINGVDVGAEQLRARAQVLETVVYRRIGTEFGRERERERTRWKSNPMATFRRSKRLFKKSHKRQKLLPVETNNPPRTWAVRKRASLDILGEISRDNGLELPSFPCFPSLSRFLLAGAT